MNEQSREVEQEITVQDDVIEGSRGLVLQLCHEVDPKVVVTLTPYHWHGEAVLDIGLHLRGYSHHLQVTADRLRIVWDDHEILKHDIEEAIHDLHAHGLAGSVNEAGFEVDHTMPDAVSTFEQSREPRPAPAEVPAGSQLTVSRPEPVGAGEAAEPERPVAPLRTRGTAAAGGLLGREPADALDPADREVLDRTVHLVHHLLEALEPEATASFEEYHWHGELTLDIAVSLHGHLHHYEVTSDRCRLFLEDHEMLRHDLEGVIEELHREAAGAGYHLPVPQAKSPAEAARTQ